MVAINTLRQVLGAEEPGVRKVKGLDLEFNWLTLCSVVLIILISFPICIIENHCNSLAPVSGRSCLHLRVVYAEHAGLGPVPTVIAPWSCIMVSSAWCLHLEGEVWWTKDLGWRGWLLHAWLSRAVPRISPHCSCSCC